MKKNLLILAAAAAALTFASCDNAKKTTEQAAEEVTTAVQEGQEMVEEAAQNVAEKIEDFTQRVGTYEGTLPAADADGYVTVLTLNADNTYTVAQTAGANKFDYAGQWNFDVESQRLILTDAKDATNNFQFIIEGNDLVMCNPVDGTVPADKAAYTLVRR